MSQAQVTSTALKVLVGVNPIARISSMVRWSTSFKRGHRRYHLHQQGGDGRW